MSPEVPMEAQGGAAHALKLPGRRLNLTALTYAKKFRNYGWKEGALQAFKELEKVGLGTLESESSKAGIQVISKCLVFQLLIQYCHSAGCPSTGKVNIITLVSSALL